jgi:DNA modification methylase
MDPLLTKKRTHKGKVAIKRLKPFEDNPRKMTDKEMGALERSILNYGFVEPVVVDENYFIIGGHQRVLAAASLDMKSVPVVMLEGLTQDEKTALNLALNKIHGDWDEVKLTELLDDLSENAFDLDLTGFTKAEVDGLLSKLNKNKTGEDDYTPQKVAKYEIEKGSIWAVGRHRMMCGDSSKIGDMDALMDGMEADMVFTDPPYGIDYHGIWLYSGKPIKSLYPEGIEGDINENAKDLMVSSLSNIPIKPGSPIYICAPPGRDSILPVIVFDMLGWHYQTQIVWNKDSIAPSRWDYKPKHEFISYGWNKKPHRFYGANNVPSVWDVPRHHEMGCAHPNMKPIELVANAIKNSSQIENLIVDPFGGSGTTIIASEQLDRKCYMMEIDPYYCSVIIDRWETLTGKVATII